MKFVRPGAAAPALLAVLATACAHETAAPPTAAAPGAPQFIVNGTPTGNSLYPSVGALLWDWQPPKGTLDGNDQWCTGSLISPTVFLTAAHCVVPSGAYTPPGTQFYVSFAGDLLSNKARFIKATGYKYDPLYGHDQANLHDLAVVFLPENATKGMTIYKLPPAGYLDQLHAQGGLRDAVFINVGYGTSNRWTGVPGFPWDGLKKWSESAFMALQPYWLGLLMNANATDLGGDCYGDSGGPKFLKGGDPDMIFATVTTGDVPCRATSWDYRLDTEPARAFLGQFVKLP